MSYSNIPGEMHEFRQWILWRMEWRSDDPNHELKPTKIPYQVKAGGFKASVTKPGHWSSFAEAVAAPFCEVGKIWNPHDPAKGIIGDPVTEFNGIGFVFTDNDPYTGIDLDDTHGDQEAYERQFKIFREFNSYSELSPSGNGLHIIIKGEVPGGGRRRAAIEIYSRERYFTMTGNVQNAVAIEQRQYLLNILHNQMGGKPEEYDYADEKAQTQTDEEVIAMARNAANGDKFNALYDGNWQPLYAGDQSRADFALVDILAFYSRNTAQITRLFLSSQLGQRDKARDRPGYVGFMVKKSFDNQVPLLDLEGWRLKQIGQMSPEQLKSLSGESDDGRNREKSTAATLAPEPCLTTAPSEPVPLHGSVAPARPVVFPPGLVGEVASFILAASPRPVPQIALAAAIGMLSGITSRAYNVSGTGLNQYVLLLARTGVGKDAIGVGISKLMTAVKQTVHSAIDFQGPGQLVSSAGIIKWLNEKPAVFCILGEFGLTLQQMSAPNANAHLLGLQKTLLEIYSRSGSRATFDPMAYSDKANNTATINSPSLTIIAESVPGRFYEALDEAMVSSGLLPRFMIYEYLGDREYFREGSENVHPSFSLVQQLCDLVAQCISLAHNGNVHNIPMTAEAQAKLKEFDRWTTDEMNRDKTNLQDELWNRAHLKAMKLAAVVAVGINYLNPLITIDEVDYATNEVVSQTRRLLNKFEDGEVGNVATNAEAKQRQEIYKAIGRYMTYPVIKAIGKYGGSKEMHKAGVILDSHIQKRVMSLAAFRLDKFGSSNAIKRALGYMLQSDEMRELSTQQMFERYGTKAKGYIVTMPEPFLEAARKDEAEKVKKEG